MAAPPWWCRTTCSSRAAPGEKVRRNLLQTCPVHTLLRLPTGIWYSPGVKANVLFFDKKEGSAKAWTDKLWIYDLRTNKHFTLKQKPLRREDFDEFIACYKPGRPHARRQTWSEANPTGRWRSYDYKRLLERDKLSLDIFWIKNDSLTAPAPCRRRKCWPGKSRKICKRRRNDSTTSPLASCSAFREDQVG